MSKREHPPVMVSAVVERAREGMEEVLIARIGSPPYEGLWTFPRGPAEDNEVPEEALRRAMRMTLGMNIHIRYGQPPFDQEWDGLVCRWRFFFCEAAGGKIEDSHYTEHRWVPKGQLCEYEFDPVCQAVIDWLRGSER